MNALVGRDCTAANAAYVAVLGDGTVLRTADAFDLVRRLRAAGVNEFQMANESHGRGQLLEHQRRAVFDALRDGASLP